jgi:hypothetical protein
MLAQNISRIDVSRDEIEVNHSRCNSLAYSMEREHSMPLVELRMDLGGTIHN